MNPLAMLLAIALLAQGLTVGPWTFERLEEAHAALSADRPGEAARLASEIVERDDLSDHERALGWQTLGYARAARDDAKGAAEAFQRCLALDALPPEVARDTRFDLARSRLAAGQGTQATAELESWLAEVDRPSPESRHLIAAAYAEQGENGKAIEQARAAVAAKASPPRAWLELLASLLIAEDRVEEALPALEALATRFPEARTWRALAGGYERVGRPERSLAVLELSFRRGFLAEPADIDRLVSRYLAAGTPARAATLLEAQIAGGRVTETPERLATLATSWRLARAPDRAAEALRRALDLAPAGRLWLQLGEVEMDRGDPASAEAAFREARADPRSRDAAQRWLEHLETRRPDGSP